MKRDTWVAFAPFYLLVALLFIGAATGGSHAVSTIKQNQPVKRAHTVIVDPGHGGEDGGATSCTGVLESSINLDISLRLDDLLHLLGVDTRLIRTTDTSIYTQGNTIAAKKISDLKERVRIVNETAGGLLVSIHQNTFSDQRYGGAQVFYAPADGSKLLAEQMQSSLIASVNPGSNRKCKKADSVYLMQHIRCPGVLVECGFLSNPKEEASLRDAAYQKKLCCVIAAAVSSYLNA